MKKQSIYFTIKTLGVLLLVLFSLFQPVTALQQQVNFKEYSWEQANRIASEQNKLLFFDVYQEDNPRKDQKAVKKELFSNPEIAAYFNKHFVNVKMDMGSKQGKAFAPRLQMLMYPTLVIFGPNETQLAYSNVMSFEEKPEAFLKFARDAVLAGERLIASNNSKTKFVENPLWNDLLKKAQERDKPIVIDFYTTWCRPCIQMDRKVFTRDEVADFYNENFVLAKYDAEKGEGIELNEKFKVWGYPTYIFLDPEGEQIHRVEGYTEADSMIIAAEKALKIYEKDSKLSSYIDFESEDASFADIKQMAREQGKLIFLDAYTTWCGPCKQMDKTVFRDSEVASYFSKHFINAKFDMEKGEGIKLKEKFKVQAFPTYLFINPETEEIVHRVVGSLGKDKFLEQAQTSLTPDENMAAMQQAYQAGNRGPVFIRQYLTQLNTAYLKEKTAQVAADYLKNQPLIELTKDRNWVIFMKYFKDINTPVFEYVLNNRSVFQGKFGKKKVNDKLYSTILSGANTYLDTAEDGKSVFDEEGFEKYLKKVDNWNPPDEKKIILLAKINNYERSFQWAKFAEAVEDGLQMEDFLSSLQLWNYAMFTERNCKNKEILLKAAHWAKIAADRDDSGSMWSHCKEMQAVLLKKAGKKKDAERILAELDGKEKSPANGKMMIPLQQKND